VRVLGIRHERIEIGDGTLVQSEAVTIRVAIDGGAVGTAVVTDTVHAISVRGTWRWILPAWRADLYRAGRCPDGTLASPLPAV
jgi:hypothetical protein